MPDTNKEPKKLLLVDDDEFLLDMYSMKFREANFSIDIASSGSTALEKMKNNTYDVVLLDIVMPSMDGFEVLAELKKNNLLGKAIIIVLSNLGQKEDIERGIQLGATDYVIKAHFTPREVVEKVQYQLSRKK
ncbi:MAG: response regulator [Patescibacteria group bacterium]